MATITVHLLNFHGPFSHIEIVLETHHPRTMNFIELIVGKQIRPTVHGIRTMN